MKPLNINKETCSPISSNCVLWNGPDIQCLDLCKGDTVTDVVYKAASELCEVLNILNITSYDISCFNLGNCAPETFQQLIQYLIGQICDLNQITTNNGGSSTPNQIDPPAPGEDCPDCVVNIADCFYFINGLGDTVTQMSLKDYAIAMGNKICAIIQGTIAIQEQVNQDGNRIGQLENQVAELAPYVPPTVTPVCVLPSVATEMDIVLAAVETQFCDLRQATGMPADLYNKIGLQCAGLNSEQVLSGGTGTMSSIPGWTPGVTNVAQALGNMWLTICDMRQAIKNIKLNCCPSGCDGILLNLYAQITGNSLTVYISGTVPAGFAECSGVTQLRITDSNGNYITVNFSILAYLNDLGGYVIDLTSTPVNATLDLTLEMQPCLSNSSTAAVCQSCLEYVLVNTGTCPVILTTSTVDSISYSFNAGTGNYTYEVQLWNSLNTVMISANSHVISGPAAVAGVFNGLTAGTLYNVRIKITSTACPTCPATECPFTGISTAEPPCFPPINVVPSFVPIV